MYHHSLTLTLKEYDKFSEKSRVKQRLSKEITLLITQEI